MNLNRENEYNEEGFDIEGDEIAKIYALADMKEQEKKWAQEKAQLFYKDFEDLDINSAVRGIVQLIKKNEISKEATLTLFDNLIEVFEEVEEYEKCHKCNEIKKGVDAKI
jgi:hypothetical protein